MLRHASPQRAFTSFALTAKKLRYGLSATFSCAMRSCMQAHTDSQLARQCKPRSNQFLSEADAAIAVAPAL